MAGTDHPIEPGDPTLPRRGGFGQRETHRGGSLPAPTQADGATVPRTRSRRARAADPGEQPPTPPPTAAQPGFATTTRLESRYLLGEQLGRGGMGLVRLARDPRLGREVAVKVLHEAGRESVLQFVEEAQITSQLEHPNIVPVHELGRDPDGRPWLVMKRVGGVALDEMIGRWRKTEVGAVTAGHVSRVLAIFDRICDAVAFAHSRGILHRDLKPANVMIGEFGEVMVMDWGLSGPIAGGVTTVMSERRADEANVTIQGDVFGTPAYMPPEQAAGRVDRMDERSDIFSLGGILYAMLTLETPYSGRDVQATLDMARDHRLVPPRRRVPQRDIPRDLDAIVVRAMAAVPQRRYSTVAEFRQDLDRFRSFESTSAYRPGPLERTVRFMRRRPTLAASIVLVLVFGAAVATVAAALGARAADAERRSEADARIAAVQKQRADAEEFQRHEAERVARDAELQRLMAEGKVRDVAARLGASAITRRDEAIDRLMSRWKVAQTSGATFSTFIRGVSAADVDAALNAYDALLLSAEIFDTPIDAEDCFNRARLLAWGRKDYDAALLNMDRAQSLGLESPWLFVERAAVRVSLGDFPAALRDLDAALVLDPDVEPALVSRSAVRRLTGDPQGALADGARAVQLSPRDAAAWCNRGAARSAVGDAEGAVADFDEALRLDSGLAEAWLNRGIMHLDAGRGQLAANDLNRAIELDPANAVAWYNRGRLRQLSNMLRPAIEDYNRTLELAPRFAPAWSNRGLAKLQTGDVQAATVDLRSAVRADPGYWQAWGNLALALVRGGDRAGAAHAFNEALRLCPPDRRAGVLAQRQRELGD